MSPGERREAAEVAKVLGAPGERREVNEIAGSAGSAGRTAGGNGNGNADANENAAEAKQKPCRGHPQQGLLSFVLLLYD